jgi:Domain of unknown function (DUF4160)
MPEICRFYGIVIKMYFADHAPPHFHAEYAEHEVRIAIDSLAVITGRLPPRAMGLVAEWASLHQSELRARWKLAQAHESPGRIDPLP